MVKWDLIELRELEKTEFCNRRHISRPYPQVGEIVLLQSPDGYVRSANVKRATRGIHHCPVCILLPLEIRSIDHSDKEQPREKPQNIILRVQPPRKAKLDVRHNKNKKDEFVHTSSSNKYNYLSRVILYPLMLSLISQVDAAYISCAKGSLEVKPPSLSHKLCLNHVCRMRGARCVIFPLTTLSTWRPSQYVHVFNIME